MPNLPKKLKKTVFDRAKGCCEYCQCQAAFSVHTFSIEHIIPTVKGGTDELDNLALSCQGCNGAKSIKTEGHDPATKKTAPLFNPRIQDWKQHFRWDNDHLSIVGLTATGRATIHELKMNREGVYNHRRAVLALGEHPPEGTT